MNDLVLQFFDGWRAAAYAALKAVALFITAAAAFRLTLRRTIAEFTPFDWVTGVAVGAIVGRTATAPHTPWLTGAAALVALIAAHDTVARLRFIPWVRRLVDPPVRVLIRDGQPDEKNLRRCRLTHEDLEVILRQHGYRAPAEIRLALFETKGVVSVFADAEPVEESPRGDAFFGSRGVGARALRIDDLEADVRWPRYRRAALRQTPMRSTLSLRMFAGRQLAGALNLHAEQSYAFDDDSVKVGSACAGHLALAWHILQRRKQFRGALASRDVIGQAKGILMERFGLQAGAAFELLKRLSQESNTPVADVARRLVVSAHPPHG